MIIYPAIDLRQGKCIRLYQGNYNQETLYSVDPLSTLKYFVAEGAQWLHIVDLDGAKDPSQHQTDLIIKLINTAGISVQTGGGVRTKEQVKKLLDQGAARVVIGSVAIKKTQEIKRWFDFFGAEKLVIALDVIYDQTNQPKIAVNAWQNVSRYPLIEVIEYYLPAGLKHVICTDISRDGTLCGPNDALYEMLVKQFPFLNLQASGGIQNLSDVQLLKKKNIGGVIIGRALYENKLTLPEVLSC